MKGFTETDMVLSLAMFTIFIIVVALTLTNQFTVYKERADNELLETQARDTVNMIVKSPGNPVRWDLNVSSVTEFGLAYDSYFTRPVLLDYRKINSTNQLTYSKLKELTDSQDIRIIIQDKVLNSTYSFGENSQRKELSSIEMPVAIRYNYSYINRGTITVIQWQ